MHHWRENCFKTLTEAADQASAVPAWAEYAHFCERLEKGLRQDAFGHLKSFIETAAEWPLSEKKRFVSWLYHFAAERPDDSFLLMPHPLRLKFLEPALAEWIVREPESGEPHRWISTIDHLEEAIRLEPTDEIARERMVKLILGGVDSAQNHLLCCNHYAGNAEEDLQALEKVEPHIEAISNEDKRAHFYVEVIELRESIQRYLRGEREI
jgi:hypothetical protein